MPSLVQLVAGQAQGACSASCHTFCLQNAGQRAKRSVVCLLETERATACCTGTLLLALLGQVQGCI